MVVVHFLLLVNCFYKITPVCILFVFSSGAAINQSVYSLLDEYIPRDFETLLHNVVCSHMLKNCSNNGFGDAFLGIAAVIFYHSTVASKDTCG